MVNNLREYMLQDLTIFAIVAFAVLVTVYIVFKIMDRKKAKARTAYYNQLIEQQRKRRLPRVDANINYVGKVTEENTNDDYQYVNYR